MRSSKSIRNAIVLLYFLLILGIANSSNALKITSISGSSEEFDWGAGASHSVTVTTNNPYYVVEWYINNVYQGCTPGGYEGDENGPTTATFSFSGLTGNITGTKYAVKAVASDQENHRVSASDTRSYRLTVWKPYAEYSKSQLMSVYGYREITKQYYSPPSIIAECTAYAYNPLEDGPGTHRSGWIDFYHEVTGPGVDEAVDVQSPPGEFPQQGTYGSYSAFLPVSIELGFPGR